MMFDNNLTDNKDLNTDTLVQDMKDFMKFFKKILTESKPGSKLNRNEKLNTLTQPVNGYEYLLGQVINGLLSNSRIVIDTNKIVNSAIDITTILIQENNKRYDEYDTNETRKQTADC